MKPNVLAFLLLLVCGVSLPSLSGLLVFPFSIVPNAFTVEYAVLLSFVFLFTAIFLRRHKTSGDYWQIFFAFFVASVAILFDLLVNLPVDTMNRLLMDMFVSASIIVVTIILLTRVAGNSFSSIFLKRSKVKLGLTIGFCGFSFFALTSSPAAQYLFQAKNLNMERIIGWLPWIIPVVLLNGVREELLYRGIFLKKIEPKLGLKTSNLLQAIIFSLSHSVAGVGPNSYTPFIWILMVFTFSLGLCWGYIMQRTGSVLGSTLFHAGTDIPVFFGIFSNAF